MSALFIVCRKDFGDNAVKNKDIVACVAKYQKSAEDEDAPSPDDESSTGAPLNDAHLEALNYFGHLNHGDDAHRNTGNLMRAVRAFRNRVLAGIKLAIQSNARPKRDLYRFVTDPRETEMPCEGVEVHLSYPPEPPTTPQPETRPKLAPLAPFGHHTRYGSDNTYPQNKEGGCIIKKFGGNIIGKLGQNSANGASSESWLALDFETYAEPKIGKKGRITATGDALEIRLATLADPEGNISQLICAKRQSCRRRFLPPFAKRNLLFTMRPLSCDSWQPNSGFGLSASSAC
jgi:hypothetical protein